MLHFIGDKNLFGIEFIPLSQFKNERGQIKLWINNFSIGYPLDDDFFFVFLNGLWHLTDKAEYFPELNDKSDMEILTIIHFDDNAPAKYGATVLHFGESFDSYITRFILLKNNDIKLIIGSEDSQADRINIITIQLTRDHLYDLLNEFVKSLRGLNPKIEI